MLVAELEFERERVEPTRIPIPREQYSAEEFSGAYVKIIFEADKVLPPPEADDPRGELGFKFHEIWLLPRDARS
jgi:hypothetical protein